MGYFLASAAIAALQAALWMLVETGLNYQIELDKYNKAKALADKEAQDFATKARNSCNVGKATDKLKEVERLNGKYSPFMLRPPNVTWSQQSAAQQAIEQARHELWLAKNAANQQIAAFRAQQALQIVKPQFSKIFKARGKIGAAISGLAAGAAALAAFRSGTKDEASKLPNKCSSSSSSSSSSGRAQLTSFLETAISLIE